MTQTKKLTLASALSALGVVALYLTAVFPTGGLALAAVAGILPCIVVLQCGVGYAVMHYGVVSALALLLVPDKSYVLWYVFALGHYGILKLLIERHGTRVLRWVLKLAVFAVSIAALFWLFSAAFVTALPDWPNWILFAVLAVVFVAYDCGLTGALRMYSRRIARFFNQ